MKQPIRLVFRSITEECLLHTSWQRSKVFALATVMDDDQSGYIQQLRAVENRIFDLFDAHKTEWEQNGLDTKEIQRLYKEVDKLVNKAFLGLQKS